MLATPAALRIVGAPRSDAWAVTRLIAAASAARRRGAPEAARQLATRALAEPPPPDLRWATLEELGFDELDVGDADGVGHLHEAWTVAPSDVQRGQVALRLDQALHGIGAISDAIRVLASSLDKLSSDVEPELYRALGSELIVKRCRARCRLISHPFRSPRAPGVAASETRAQDRDRLRGSACAPHGFSESREVRAETSLCSRCARAAPTPPTTL
jgi:hypothetical protein